jgi:hypothetical protein
VRQSGSGVHIFKQIQNMFVHIRINSE